MFAIYGISGPIFQGTLENLGQVSPVLRSGPVMARRVGDQITGTVPPEESTFAAALDGMREQALDAYQAMLPQNLERGPLYQANQLMQRHIITVSSEDDVARAWHILVENQIHQAPVLDATLHLVGIIGERNLLVMLNVNVDDRQMRKIFAQRVGDVMTTPVVAATPVTDIRHIAHVMLDRDVDGLPIVNDSGTLVGFLSRGDILRAVVNDPPLSIWR
jgi:CBS domain-containing protein